MLAIAYGRDSIRCIACRGKLGVSCVGLPCPHCGELIENLVDEEMVDLDEMAVREDAYCRGCGYNLRTLSVSSECPECGGRVVESIAEPSLSFSDHDWLRHVHFGTKALAAGVIGLWVSALAGGVGGIDMVCLSVPCFLVSMLLLVAGSICVFNADPRSLPRKNAFWSNRLALILPLVLLFISIFVPVGMSMKPLPIVTIAVGLAIVVSVVAVGLRLKGMAVRQGRLQLAKHTVVAFVITAVAVSLLLAVEVARGGVWSAGLGPVEEVLLVICTLLLGISSLVTLGVIFRIISMVGEARWGTDRS